MGKSVGGGVGGVLAGFTLGAAVTLGALWATKGHILALTRPSTDSPSQVTFEQKVQRAEVACKRQFPSDGAGQLACFMALTERAQAEFENGFATQYDGGTARAALEAGIR
jgi:hypothetical protein